MTSEGFSRRDMLRRTGALSMLAAMEQLLPSYVWARQLAPAEQRSAPLALTGETIALTIADTPFRVGRRTASAQTINGTLPGPLIRLREGQDVTLNVTNRLKELSSIHWHGLLVPHDMDGVPGVSFAGIEPGETFVYKFKVRQYGTYWYHSHSPGQEQAGVYAPLIIDPLKSDPVAYDREYVVVLSDWTTRSEDAMIARLKKQAGVFNFQQRTMGEFLSDVRAYGWRPTMDNYLTWARMRMDPTDFADVTGAEYTYLMNGLPSEGNWTALFSPKERVRIRFINAGAMTFHDIRIPDLKMTIVQADGQNVQPVEIDEFRIGPAETYDVIVAPTEDRAYTIFSEVLGRSGYVRGTLAPRPGMSADIPERRKRPLRTMDDMGMSMEGMDMPGMKLEMDKNMKAGAKMSGMDMSKGQKDHDMKMPEAKPPSAQPPAGGHEQHTPQTAGAQQPQQPGMPSMPGMQHSMSMPGNDPVKHGPDTHGSGNQSTPMVTKRRLDDPGAGLGGDGRRVLLYSDLKALEKWYDTREPQRELEIHLTGHMERFIWSLDGKKFSQAREPIRFHLGERLRWTFVNDTMMEHTMHLHGMFMHLENGAGEFLPRKHTVLVKPAERLSVAITPDERGPFAFHCHLVMHMEMGMFRVVLVDGEPQVRS